MLPIFNPFEDKLHLGLVMSFLQQDLFHFFARIFQYHPTKESGFGLATFAEINQIIILPIFTSTIWENS